MMDEQRVFCEQDMDVLRNMTKTVNVFVHFV